MPTLSASSQVIASVPSTREEGYDQVQPQLRVDAEEARTVFPDHREDGAGLDRDVEHLAALVVRAEEVACQDQVPGARDGQELGQPFDDAEDQRVKNFHMFSQNAGALSVLLCPAPCSSTHCFGPPQAAYSRRECSAGMMWSSAATRHSSGTAIFGARPIESKRCLSIQSTGR